jgi:hypothetical protein
MFVSFIPFLNNGIGLQNHHQCVVPLQNHCAQGHTFWVGFISFNEIMFVSFKLYLNNGVGLRKPHQCVLSLPNHCVQGQTFVIKWYIY